MVYPGTLVALVARENCGSNLGGDHCTQITFGKERRQEFGEITLSAARAQAIRREKWRHVERRNKSLKSRIEGRSGKDRRKAARHKSSLLPSASSSLTWASGGTNRRPDQAQNGANEEAWRIFRSEYLKWKGILRE